MTGNGIELDTVTPQFSADGTRLLDIVEHYTTERTWYSLLVEAYPSGDDLVSFELDLPRGGYAQWLGDQAAVVLAQSDVDWVIFHCEFATGTCQEAFRVRHSDGDKVVMVPSAG